MELTYRDVQYKPSIMGQATVPTEGTGTYRGAKQVFRRLKQPLATTGFAVLTYRGAQYRSFRYSQATSVVHQETPLGREVIEPQSVTF